MKSILRATAILSASSSATVLIGVVAAKFRALLLGPSGYGLLSLEVAFTSFANIISGLGVAVGMVKLAAPALAGGNLDYVGQVRRAAAWVIGVITCVVMVCAVLGAGWLNKFAFRGIAGRRDVILLGLTLSLGLLTGVQTGTLNAYHRVTALAKAATLSSCVGSALGVGCIWIWRERGIAPGLVVAGLVMLATNHLYVRRQVPPVSPEPPAAAVWKVAGSLMRFGGPYALSLLVGSGVQVAIPFLVLRGLGQVSVGWYQAASVIAVNYLAFLTAAMSQDYYPRLSAARLQPDSLVAVINEQHRVLMLIATPVILGMLSALPYMIPLLYTQRFMPAIAILEWLLIGDILRLSSWTMSFVVLASFSSLAFFTIEAFSGACLLVSTWLCMRQFGLAGVGLAYVITYAAYYTVVTVVVKRRVPLRWSRDNRLYLGLALSITFAVRSLAWLGLPELARTEIGLAVTVLVALWAFYRLRAAWNRADRLDAALGAGAA